MKSNNARWESDEKRIIVLDLLKTPSRRRILSLLLLQDSHGGGLYLRELARSLKTSAATISYHLEKLQEHGLVKAISTGYKKYFVITDLGKLAMGERDTRDFSFSARVKLEQVYSREYEEVVLENELGRVIVVPGLGSRVVELRCFSIFDFLHRLYPTKAKLPEYQQYGGIEHTLNPFPGIGYLSNFNYEIESSKLSTSLDMDLGGRSIRYAKGFALDSTRPLLRIDHSFRNLSEKEVRFSWSSHPEISIGGSPVGNQIAVPEKRMKIVRFSGDRKKSYYHPNEPWWAATHPAAGLILGQVFPINEIDRIGVWQDNSYYTVELIIDKILLPPNEEYKFSTWYIFTRGSEDTVKSLSSVLPHQGEGS